MTTLHTWIQIGTIIVAVAVLILAVMLLLHLIQIVRSSEKL